MLLCRLSEELLLGGDVAVDLSIAFFLRFMIVRAILEDGKLEVDEATVILIYLCIPWYMELYFLFQLYCLFPESVHTYFFSFYLARAPSDLVGFYTFSLSIFCVICRHGEGWKKPG